MLTPHPFTPRDLEQVKHIPRRFMVMVFLYVASIPLALVLGLMGLMKPWDTYWSTVWMFVGVSTAVFLWAVIRTWVNYRKDLREQVKLCGTVTVTGKAPGKNSTVISTNAPELPRLDVKHKTIFQSITPGDTLEVEISKYSGVVLMMNGRW